MRIEILPSHLTPDGKLKNRIQTIAITMLLLSLLLIDVINMRTAGHENGLVLLIKNIHLMTPWGLAYFIAIRYRNMLKIFLPIYMSLVLLVATCSLASHHFKKSQNFEKKFGQEMMNILKEQSDFIDKMDVSSQIQSRTYSADDYGPFALYLNRFKKSMDFYKQESLALLQASNEVELNKIFTEEVLFNFDNIIEKKKQLEKLLVILDESAHRTENIYSDYVTWVLYSPDLDEMSRKNLAQAISTSPDEKRFLRQEPYRIKKNIIQEYINFLDFMSKAYGSYEIAENGGISFIDDEDVQTWNFHCETLNNLFIEENKLILFSQEKIAEAENSLPKMNN